MLLRVVVFMLQSWTDLMTAVSADPWASAYTMFDILNEPDARGLKWQASNGAQGVGDMYHQIMSIGNKINPSATLFLHV